MGRTLLRSITETKYFALLREIQSAGGVPCDDHPDLMFPEDIPDPDLRAASTRLAKALCRSCPIVGECFTYALETHQRYGIWGGTTAQER